MGDVDAIINAYRVANGTHVISACCNNNNIKGPYADHILIPQGSTGSSTFFDIKWKSIFFWLQIQNFSFNRSHLAKMKKEYSWHVPAIKFIGMKQLV